MELTTPDIHTLLFSFLGVMIAEVVVKPIAIRTGRSLLRKLDDHIVVIPDWLSKPKKSCKEQDEE
jgi:ABC-type molybdate transport system permease subunit